MPATPTRRRRVALDSGNPLHVAIAASRIALRPDEKADFRRAAQATAVWSFERVWRARGEVSTGAARAAYEACKAQSGAVGQ